VLRTWQWKSRSWTPAPHSWTLR